MSTLPSALNSYSQIGAAAARAAHASGLKTLPGAGTSSDTVRPRMAPSDPTVTISPEAQLAAASLADNRKDFAALSKEVRATLDDGYTKSGTKEPKLDGMSGRALAAIALNRSGDFTRTEVGAAKQSLREQMRSDFMSATRGGAGLAGMAAFSKQLAAKYDAMTSEERDARGWTEKFRATNETLLSQAEAPSLFDQLNV